MCVSVYLCTCILITLLHQTFICSIVALSYSPNGFLLASGSGSGEIRLWDPYAGLSLTSTEADDLCVSTCVFSPHHTSS